jgi:glucan phosphoethanolaminetransferase (alkaline phosphatase superfamily)
MTIPEISNLTPHFVLYVLCGFIATLLLIFTVTTRKKDSVTIKLKWYAPITLSLLLIGGYVSLCLALVEFSGNTNGWKRVRTFLCQFALKHKTTD